MNNDIGSNEKLICDASWLVRAEMRGIEREDAVTGRCHSNVFQTTFSDNIAIYCIAIRVAHREIVMATLLKEGAKPA